MTKEQAGYIIGNLKDCEEYDLCEIQEAKAMAIDALWAEPYKGMTNGEVIKAIFPQLMIFEETANKVVWGRNESETKWWNNPYVPQESEE